jgi:hypothetical protein
MTRTLLALALLAATTVAAAQTAAVQPLKTIAETAEFLRTGRYDEVVALCAAFAERYPEAVRCESFGTTPEGRDMKVLVVSRSGALDPDAARARKLPVVLMQGGIHAGEIDGKDAGFLALRQVLDGEAAVGTLKSQVWIFVPVFSVDGHERFGRWNRPNQRGPEETGWRTTAQNFNLNRDYIKADAPEMRAMLELIGTWDPILYVDLHVTNGAKFEHDISIQVEPVYSGDSELRVAGRALREQTIADLAKQGSLPLNFYPSFEKYDDPASGFADGVPPPRFSHGYMPLRNRFGLLVETHSWKDYPTRVRITRNTIVSLLEQTAKHGAAWLKTAEAADRRAAALAGTAVPLDYVASPKSREIPFRGYAYTRTQSEISGALMTRYDEATPQVWTVPLRDDVQPGTSITAPRGGYIVPSAHATAVAAQLALHGVDFRRFGRGVDGFAVERFDATKAEFAAASVEGHQRLSVAGQWAGASADIPAGSLFVPIAQPRARLAIAMLEPQAPDSLLAWGWFNNQFEQKEYMEAYVAEDVARAMLAADATLKAEFDKRLADDAAFAADPQARLDFFHRRHDSWDQRFQRYPVLRSATVP